MIADWLVTGVRDLVGLVSLDTVCQMNVGAQLNGR